MDDLTNKRAAVIGLDPSGLAVCKLLRKLGAEVVPFAAETAPSRKETAELGALGIRLADPAELGNAFDLAAHGCTINRKHPLLAPFSARNIPILSDLEIASREFRCLSIAITGTNGKTTTAEIVAAIMAEAQRRTVRAGASGIPVAEAAEQTRELDYATLDVNSFQLEGIEHFRPSVAVITNIRGDHLDRYNNLGEYARALGRIFQNQQVFDWAVVQSEALAHLRELGVPIPSKVVTFSARNRRADLFLDRGLLISALPNWTGPLFDMDLCTLRGPHHAENVMAALAVGRVLRFPLEQMLAAVKAYQPGPHRMELVAEVHGVKFVNNSKAMNTDAVQQSIQAIPEAPGGGPNLWLIAGGRDKGLDYHDLGPLLARRVKAAFLLGETREKLRAAWSLFTPCSVVDSLLEAVSKAAQTAASGDVILFSPACSSLDMFRSYQHRGEAFRAAVQAVTATASHFKEPSSIPINTEATRI